MDFDEPNSFEERARTLAAGLTGMAKTFIPVALLELLFDMCKALDKLPKE